MKLTELKPRWLEHDGKRVAIMFLCPDCVAQGKSEQWLTCFFAPAGDLPRGPDGERGERELFRLEFEKMGAADPLHEAWQVVGCRAGFAWSKDSDDLSSMSITPSIDASASGHWHGFITAGEIK